jgi:hypothetical protein
LPQAIDHPRNRWLYCLALLLLTLGRPLGFGLGMCF